MARRITTRAQISGYRFGLARAEHALIRRDVRMLHDPMRAHVRAGAAGVVIALLILAGAGVYGLIRPAPTVGDAVIVSDPGGGLFVRVDGVLHPVLNLASARLVAGAPAPVKAVSARSVASYPRGPTLGIVGAPSSLPGPAADGASTWTVCDADDGTAVLAGPLPEEPDDRGVGLLASHGERTWLIHRRSGIPVRARVDTASVEVLRALALEGIAPRPVSAALLDTFPEDPALALPVVDDRGAPGPLGAAAGTVIRTTAVDGSAVYRVILSDGMQEIPATAAEMLRAADPAASPQVRQVPPGRLTSVPVVHRLPVAHFPAAAPRIVDARVVCRSWSRPRGAPRARQSLIVSDTLPIRSGARLVALGTADGPGPRLDAVFLEPGTAEHVAATGSTADSALAGRRFVITDGGVRHRVADDRAATCLGLAEQPPRAPWSVIGLLPEGPELSREGALVVRDAVDDG